MDRREAFLGAGALAIGALASSARADDDPHAHHHGAGPHAAVAGAAGDCVAKGEVCLHHCLMLLGDGDRTMAACAKSVHAMLATSHALQSLASQDSSLTTAMAKVAVEACKACEDECRKHEDKHAACHECAEACARSQREIRVLLG